MLCEIAWVVAGKRDSYLSKWYWKLKQRKGAKKAIIDLGRKLLVMIYAMLKKVHLTMKVALNREENSWRINGYPAWS
jgi:hypothetical protein